MIRQLHTTVCRHGRLKLSLNAFTQQDLVRPPLSKKELKYREQKLLKYEKLKLLKPFTKNTAKSIIEKKLGVQVEGSLIEQRFTEEQLKELFKNPNKRLIYSFLGVSGEQLKDSMIVDKDVAKFLRRGELTKLIYLSRLARMKGVVAMNRVLQYLLDHQRVDEALSLYQYRKKWGVPPNEFTYSILFDGLSRQRKPISGKAVAALDKIVLKLKEDDELSVIHLNTVLKAYFNSNNVNKALELFDTLGRKEGLDVKIFSVYLKNLSQVQESDSFIVKQADICFRKALNILNWKQIDPKLILAYSLCYSRRKNLKYASKSISILRSWFKICDEDKISQVLRYSEPQDYRYQKIEPVVDGLLSLEEINPYGKRLPYNRYVLDTYIDSLQKLGLSKKALELFDKLSDKVDVDIGLFNTYLKSVIKSKLVMDDMGPIEENLLIKTLNKMDTLKIQPNIETNIIIYKFLDEKLTKLVTKELDMSIKLKNSVYFADYFNNLRLSILKLQSSDLSVYQTIDFLKLYNKLLSQLPFDKLILILDSVYFQHLELSDINDNINDQKLVQRVTSLEIACLTYLNNLISPYELDENRSQLKWTSINRIKNLIQRHVYYLNNVHSLEDPGFTKLHDIVQEKKLSIESYKTQILKLV